MLLYGNRIPVSRVRSCFLVFAWLWLVQASFAQNTGREYESHALVTGGLIIHVSDGAVMLTPYPENSFEIQFLREEEGQLPPGYAIAATPAPGNASIREEEAYLEYTNGDLSARIAKSPFQISYTYGGRSLLSENQGYRKHDSMEGFSFNLRDDEVLFGGGSRVLGMDRRGNRLQLYNRASYGYETHADLMYYSMPVVISSDKYMIAFDNVASGWMDLGASEKDLLQFDAVGGRMAYTITAADTWPQLAVNFTALTGRQPMAPRWGWGNIASRMGYHTQQQVGEVIDAYLHDDIPLDAIVLDLYWFGPDLKGTMGNLAWDYNAFPEPEKMMAGAKAHGVKTVLITEPFILNTSKRWDEAVREDILCKNDAGEPYLYDFYFGTTGLIDIFEPKARKWFRGIYENLTRSGVDGWWGDLGEPEVHPDDLLHVNGRADHLHNAYGHEWTRLVHDMYQECFPGKRPLILMRAGFVGSQRYGIIPWTGDVNRTWGGLKPQVEISLQMGMQGIPWMHSDLGGFAGSYKDAELYTRWLQYGVFQPMYRTHAQEEVPAEPVYWDDATKSIVRRYIKLRYRLLPYNYTLMHDNSTTGIPFMRPLFYLEDSPALVEYNDAYLWGDSFIVAPITDKGASERKLYLPIGSNWYDYWTGEAHQGGREITVDVTLENIPVFVRGGAFIPMVPAVQTTDKYASRNLAVHYYRDPTVPESSGHMYEDDGWTRNAYAKGLYELLEFNAVQKDGHTAITIDSDAHDYAGRPDMRNMMLIVHNLDTPPRRVAIDGKAIPSHEGCDEPDNEGSIAAYDPKLKRLNIQFKWAGNRRTVLID